MVGLPGEGMLSARPARLGVAALLSTPLFQGADVAPAKGFPLPGCSLCGFLPRLWEQEVVTASCS